MLGYWSLQSVAGSIEWSEIASAATGSLLVSGLAATVAAACAIPIAVLSGRYGGPLERVIERLSFTGYALPGIVVASFVFEYAQEDPTHIALGHQPE